MEDLQNGSFMMGNPNLKWMMTGGYPHDELDTSKFPWMFRSARLELCCPCPWCQVGASIWTPPPVVGTTGMRPGSETGRI